MYSDRVQEIVQRVLEQSDQLEKRKVGDEAVVEKVFKNIFGAEDDTMSMGARGGAIWITQASVLRVWNMMQEVFHLLQTQQGCVTIAWLGCGDCKECVCFVLLARQRGINLKIRAIEIEEGCVHVAKNRIERHGMQEHISLVHGDAMQDECKNSYDIVYTTAPVGLQFNLNWARFAVHSCEKRGFCYMAGFLGDHWPRQFVFNAASSCKSSTTVVLAKSGNKERTLYFVKMSTSSLDVLRNALV